MSGFFVFKEGVGLLSAAADTGTSSIFGVAKPVRDVSFFYIYGMYTVYALYNPQQKTYIGFTSNLEQRLRSHNEFSTKDWTAKFRPWTLFYQEQYESRAVAMRREKELKTGKGREFLRKILTAKTGAT